tara:strand:- start:683 stop:835 length:153 start_codon:yes stop_codon:yes gene_type:complete
MPKKKPDTAKQTKKKKVATAKQTKGYHYMPNGKLMKDSDMKKDKKKKGKY